MLRKLPRVFVVLAALAMMAAAPVLAEEKFDLKVDLDLSPSVTSMLAEGDVLQVILRPAIQFGERTTTGSPIVLEQSWAPGASLDTVVFDKALLPDQLYRLEMKSVRRDERGRDISARYVSALAKLPRKPVEQEIRMRLFRDFTEQMQAARRGTVDERHNLVYLTQDSD